MTKQATRGTVARGDGAESKVTRKLDKARAAQQKAGQKVGKVRAQLAAAESKLAKRVERVSTLQAHTAPAHEGKRAMRAPKKRATVQPTEHERLAALGMAAAAASVRERDAMPIATPNSAAPPDGDVPASDGEQPRKLAQERNSQADGATTEIAGAPHEQGYASTASTQALL